MIKSIASLLALIYVPTMWIFAGLLIAIGLMGLLAPKALRRGVSVFRRNGVVRVLSVVLLLVGMQMFIRAPATSWPWLVKVLGVIVFMGGGVSLLIPAVSVMITEYAEEQSTMLFRLMGLCSLGVAYLFYLATKLPAPSEVVEGAEQAFVPVAGAVTWLSGVLSSKDSIVG